MKTRFLILAFFVLLIALNNSCLLDSGPQYINPCPCDTTPFKDCDCDTDTLTVLSYSINVQPIWDVYCIECHDGNIEQVNLKTDVSYSTVLQYVNTTLPEASEIYQMMYMNVMPPEEDFRPTNDELDIVLAWIMQGAKNN